MSNSDEEKSFAELLSEYQDQENLNHFEGSSGLDNLNKICNAIGYCGHGFKFGSSLEEFLGDNPGACDAIIEWLNNEDTPQFREELLTHLQGQEDDEDLDVG